MKLYYLIIIFLFVSAASNFSQQFVQEWEFPDRLRYVGDIDGDGIGEFAFEDEDSLRTTFYDGKSHDIKWTIDGRDFQSELYYDERASAVPKYNKYPLMDYDNDGTKDIFFNNDGKISIINPVNNNTVFEFLDSTATRTHARTDLYVLSDIDGDKELEIVFLSSFEDVPGNRTYKTHLFSTGIATNSESNFKTASTTFQNHQSTKSNTEFTLEWEFQDRLDYVGDIDGDGIGEFAHYDNNQQIMTYYDGNNHNIKWNTFGIRYEFELFYADHQRCLLPEGNEFPVQDYNGDGVCDFFFSTDSSFQIVSISNDSVLFEFSVPQTYFYVLSDVDGDGFLELVLTAVSNVYPYEKTYVFSTTITSSNKNISNTSFLNNAASSGQFEKLWEFAEELYFMGDMDGDGIGEFFLTDYATNNTNFYSFQNDNIKWQFADQSFQSDYYYAERMSAMPPFNIFPVLDFNGDNIKEIPHMSNDEKETILYDVVNDSVVFNLSGQDIEDSFLSNISDVNGNGDLELVFWVRYYDGSKATQVYSTGVPVTALQNTNILHPGEYELAQNYPNPFNPTTKIKYAVPVIGFVTLKIYDVLGKEIATLVNEEKPAGSYEVEFNASELNLTSGVYFYRITTGGFEDTKKLLLLK
ncbi:MAG: hypothetical protein A2057_07590 [Ignavibacteria bacterium GWA2_35_9]|nr:MAG: hypothetical protein A2057_07590 [Ignavibacteria bacterium GWA2_35_9]OGU49798.1 MAG: hypothetical protein A2080_04055 [Ignavibacteria bacterium GWC2_36_12]